MSERDQRFVSVILDRDRAEIDLSKQSRADLDCRESHSRKDMTHWVDATHNAKISAVASSLRVFAKRRVDL